jgi:type II secretory pathway component GspD/PulD (secretin)
LFVLLSVVGLWGQALAQVARLPAATAPAPAVYPSKAAAAAARSAPLAAPAALTPRQRRAAAAAAAQAASAAATAKPAIAAPARGVAPAATTVAPAATPVVPAASAPAVVAPTAGSISPLRSVGFALDPATAVLTAESESALTRLTHPSVASRLRLTDLQRAKLAELLTQRGDLLAKAASADRVKVIEDADQKALQLLTDEQRAELAKKPAEPKLRFAFRFQRWLDVLEWFAQQADLSLVLDAPPPGTFNYTDTREYSPVEAIDLLNGVLLTKGYSLIRRDRMLMVINLADGLPDGLIPRVSLDDLDKRGKYEFVSVLFPLAGRTPTDVLNEIKPLMGPQGKATPLAATGQILVTDTAGVMRAIGAVIQSMPLSPNAPVLPYEPPQLVVYPLKTADPQAVLQVIKGMLPQAPVVLDAKGLRISVLAGATQQAQVKSLVDQMETAGAPGAQQNLELYPLGDVTAAAATRLLTTLQTMFPQAQLSIDSRAGKLVVWATAADQKSIAAAIEKLGAENTRTVQAYRLTAADPTSTIVLLRNLVPNASLTFDADTHDLIALAVPREQDTIKATVAQLQRELPESEKPQMVAYPINMADPTNVQRMMRTMFPSVQFTLDSRTRRLIVWAMPPAQAAIKAALEKMDSGTVADAQESFMVYPLADADPKVAARMLEELYPDMKITADVKGAAILAWGRKSDHVSLAATMKQMQSGGDLEQKSRLMIYPLGNSDAAAVTLMFRSLVPTARVAVDPKTGNLAAWATPQEHAAIKAAIEQMTGKEALATAPTTGVYFIPGGGAAAVTQAFRVLFPRATFTANSPNQLIAVARPSDQRDIQKAVEQIAAKDPPERTPSAVSYALQTITAAAAMRVLVAAFPDAKFALGNDPNKLVAFARPADQEAIKLAVAQMSVKEPPETAPKLIVYIIPPSGVGGNARPAAVGLITILRTMFPDAQFTVGADPSRLMVWARAGDHAAIQKAVEELTKKELPETAPHVMTYTLPSATAAGVVPILTAMFPTAQFSAGADPSQVVALARPADHELIRKAVEEITKREPPETAPTVVVYTIPLTGMGGGKAGVKASGALAASTALKTMFPSAQFSVGADPTQLIVAARKADHAAIKAAVDELVKKESPETAPRVVVYTLESANTTAAVPMLTAMFPNAQFSAGAGPSQVVALARPADHELIQRAIEQMSKREAAETAATVTVYTLPPSPLSAGTTNAKNGPAATAATALGTMFPLAQFSVGSDPYQLIVSARKADQAAIKAAVEELSKVQSQMSLVYHFRTADPKAAATVLATLVPRAQIAADVTSRTLVAVATPEDHAKIKATVEEMDRNDTGSEAPRLQVYRVISADAGSLVKVLTALYKARPDVSVALDINDNAVVAVAPPSQQDLIHGLVEQADKGGLADTSAQLQLYPLNDVVDSTAALNIVTALFAKQATQVQLSIEPRTNQLVAIARPEQQAMIRATLAQMKSDERVMEVVQLKAVDALTAQTAIDRLFTENGMIRGPDAPQDDADTIGQQLFIKATKAQLVQIHRLLSEMGETSLAETKTTSGHTRVIPFQGDAAAALKEILKVWPQLRPNAIQVTTPSPTVGAASTSPPTIVWPEPAKPAAVAPVFPKPHPRPAPSVKAAPHERPQWKPKEKNERTKTTGKSAATLPGRAWRYYLVSDAAPPAKGPADATGRPAQPAQAPVATATPQGTTAPPAQAAAAIPANPGTAPAPAGAAAGQPGHKGAPIVVMPGESSITITSDDQEALDQLEALVRSYSRGGSVGRNLTVFMLRNANATDVASTLQSLFKTTSAARASGSGGSGAGSSSSGTSTLIAIPDARSNALVVQANRADMATVENLVRMLDTAEAPTSMSGDLMKLIPLKNTSATKVQQLLQIRFKSQNQAIGVEDQSNSLVVLAPAALAEEIARFVKELDDAAGAEISQRVKLVQLHSTNAMEVQQALDALLSKKGGSSSSSTHSSTTRASSAWPASSTWTTPTTSSGMSR